MDNQRYSRNHPYQRDSKRNPNDRAASRGRGGNYQPRRGFESRGSDRYQRGRGTYGNRGAWRNDERTFDHQGREIRGFQAPQTSFNQNYHNPDHHPTSLLTPLEEKAKNFLRTVQSQEGIRSKLIFLEAIDNPIQTLQTTVDYCQVQMSVEQEGTGEYVLKIGKEEIARGTFPNKQTAKNALAEQAMEILKKDCFCIVKQKVYEEVRTKKDEEKVEEKQEGAFAGSKAHQMMLKMGWGGKGLGVNEQGAEKTVAEVMDQNISRQGLGTEGPADIFKKIYKLLEDYSKSDKISLLRFDPKFTADERAHIHKIAQQLGLKSKSEGKKEQRRITITKKLHRGDMVYSLLTTNLENTLYKLEIPEKFQHLWFNEDFYF